MRHPYGGGIPCGSAEKAQRSAHGRVVHRIAFQVPAQRAGSSGPHCPANDFEAMQELETATGRTAPASLAALRQKTERFNTVIDPEQIAQVALSYQE